MTTVQERRLRDARNRIEHLIAQRDAVITRLVKLEGTLKMLRRAAQRYEKHIAKPKTMAKVEAKPEAKPADVTDIPILEFPIADDLSIPTFLQRKRDADKRDAIAADAIRAEQTERKRNKSRVRIETMKAKQRGDTKRIPLSGKAAREAIRQG